MVAIGKPLQFEPVTLQTYEMPVKQKKKLLRLQLSMRQSKTKVGTSRVSPAKIKEQLQKKEKQ